MWRGAPFAVHKGLGAHAAAHPPASPPALPTGFAALLAPRTPLQPPTDAAAFAVHETQEAALMLWPAALTHSVCRSQLA